MPNDSDRPAGAPIVRSAPCQLTRGPSPLKSSSSEMRLGSPTHFECSSSRRDRRDPIPDWISDSASVAGTLSGELGSSSSEIRLGSLTNFERSSSLRDRKISTSAWISDSACVAGTLNGELDEETLKRGRKRTSLSPKMERGDGMREALTYEAPLVADLRNPDIPTLIRRQMSVPGSIAESDNVLWQQRDGIARAPSVRRASWCSSAMNSEINEAMANSPKTGSIISLADGSSISKLSRTSSPYNPRARPGSLASEISNSFCSSLSRKPMTCAASQDHLWRELFHEEADEQASNRLRGEGKAIGSRGMHSNSIPWRHIPTYDSNGRMCETGDPVACRKSIVKESGMTEKKKSQFSSCLSPGHGVRELLSPVKVAPTSEDFARCSEAEKSYIESLSILKKCLAAKYEMAPDKQFNHQVPSKPSAQSGDTSSSDAAFSGSQSAQSIHWQWRQQKKGKLSVDAVKDSCPYHRIDSDGAGAKRLQSPTRRQSLGPRDFTPFRSLETLPIGPVEARVPAEKVVENARSTNPLRDFSFCLCTSPSRNRIPLRCRTPFRRVVATPTGTNWK